MKGFALELALKQRQKAYSLFSPFRKTGRFFHLPAKTYISTKHPIPPPPKIHKSNHASINIYQLELRVTVLTESKWGTGSCVMGHRKLHHAKVQASTPLHRKSWELESVTLWYVSHG